MFLFIVMLPNKLYKIFEYTFWFIEGFKQVLKGFKPIVIWKQINQCAHCIKVFTAKMFKQMILIFSPWSSSSNIFHIFLSLLQNSLWKYFWKTLNFATKIFRIKNKYFLCLFLHLNVLPLIQRDCLGFMDCWSNLGF